MIVTWYVGLVCFPLQHHCRKCGRSVCDSCCDCTSVFPRMGFETPVRMCNECLYLHYTCRVSWLTCWSLLLKIYIMFFYLPPPPLSPPPPSPPPPPLFSLSFFSRQPFAYSFNLKLIVTFVSILHNQNLLLTGNDDKTVRVWHLCVCVCIYMWMYVHVCKDDALSIIADVIPCFGK